MNNNSSQIITLIYMFGTVWFIIKKVSFILILLILMNTQIFYINKKIYKSFRKINFR